MPGLYTSSRSQSNSVVVQHDSASDFLTAAYPTMRRHEASSNIVLAHALKQVTTEAAMTGYQCMSDTDVEDWLSSADESSMTPHSTSSPLWLTLWSRSSSTSSYSLDIVLSCIDWTLGEYPIFLWTPHTDKAALPCWTEPRIEQMAQHLRDCVIPERVFSVFGFTPLVKIFSKLWSSITGNAIEPEPFYSAYFSYCNAATFRPSKSILPDGHRLRRATLGDLEQVAQLCKEFADDSVSVVLGSCLHYDPQSLTMIYI